MEDQEEIILEDTQKGKYLTFMLDRETYGMEIKYVTEIIGMEDITEIPEMPEYLKGIINLRGKIVSVMDVRLRFGKMQRGYDDRTCIIVTDYHDIMFGLIVDSVSEVLTMREEEIVDVPDVDMACKHGFVKNIGKTEKNVILLLDCEMLLIKQDLARIDLKK